MLKLKKKLCRRSFSYKKCPMLYIKTLLAFSVWLKWGNFKKVIKTPLYLYVITNSSLIHKLALFIFSETLFLILGCRKKTPKSLKNLMIYFLIVIQLCILLIYTVLKMLHGFFRASKSRSNNTNFRWYFIPTKHFW